MYDLRGLGVGLKGKKKLVGFGILGSIDFKVSCTQA